MEKTIHKILGMKTIAVVGMSPKAERASHGVAMYLKRHGYTIIPVNPGHRQIEGMTSYPDLKSIPVPVDVVDVFRSPKACVPVAIGAVEINARALWLQEGVINDEAVGIAESAGLLAVQDKCMLKEHRRVMG